MISKLPDSQEMKYSAYIMGLFKKIYIFSFEGVVAYQIRYSIIMAFDRSFSVLHTHLGEKIKSRGIYLQYDVWG